jgi:hypothetical protein
MIRFSCLLLLASLLEAQTGAPSVAAEPARKGSIRGSVISTTGEPLRKAQVMLRGTGQQRGSSGTGGSRMPLPGLAGQPSTWAQTTDTSGAFTFDDLPAGTYSLTVQKNGYVRADHAARGNSRSSASSITLGPGQAIGGISVKLTPHGVITGKVTDEDGDPVASASVQVMRERWIQGKKQVVPMNADSTNDLGEYRIAGLMPGRYQLMVNYSRSAHFTRPRPADAQSDLGYAAMYYPGTFEFSQATPISVGPGQELRGIDFQLRKVPTYRVRGKVIDVSGAPAQQVGVVALPAEGGMFGGVRGTGRVRNGTFEITGLLPGSYTLMANGGGRGRSRVFARQVVQVGSRDMDGLVLALQPTFEITGTVRVPEGVTLGQTRVFLDPMETGMPFGGGGSGVVNGNAWKIENAGPGRFRFFLSPLPDGTYIKTVTVQGQDISAGAMINAAASGVEITLGAGAPEVIGTAVNKDKEPATGSTVVLVPELGRQEQFWLFRSAPVDQNGAFALKNIAPGQYTAYAFADVEDGAWHSPDFLRQHEGKGVKVKLEENAKETVALVVTQ